MGGGSTILFWYIACFGGVVFVGGIAGALFFWGRWEEKRRRKARRAERQQADAP